MQLMDVIMPLHGRLIFRLGPVKQAKISFEIIAWYSVKSVANKNKYCTEVTWTWALL